MSHPSPKRLSPWRRSFQWTTSLTILLLPFLIWNGESLLRLDTSTLTLHLFGLAFRIEELYLFLILLVLLIFGFMLITMALGRAWCGWACPQTTLTDAVEGFARVIGVQVKAGQMTANRGQKLLLHLFYVALSLLVGANLLWYFIPPIDFLQQLGGGTLAPVAAGTMAITASLIYLNLAFVRRLMCREFCPYGRFQSTLLDRGTLTLRYHPEEAPRCIRCGACVRACPTGIDIREGEQIECINCGRCLDACRDVMARLRQAGIIRYTFGLEGKGLRALFNPRMLLLTAAFLLTATALVWLAGHRSSAELKLQRSAAASRTLADGQTVNFFTAYLINKSTQAQKVSLVAETTTSQPIELKGPVSNILLAPGQRLQVDFALLAPSEPVAAQSISVILRDDREHVLATTETVILPSVPQKEP